MFVILNYLVSLKVVFSKVTILIIKKEVIYSIPYPNGVGPRQGLQILKLMKQIRK